MPVGVNPDVAKAMGIAATITNGPPAGETVNSGVVKKELERPKVAKIKAKKKATTEE